MRKILLAILALVLVLGSASAFCVCINSGPCGCDDSKYTSYNDNVTVWVSYTDAAPNASYQQATDRPAGARWDTLGTTREYVPPYSDRIEVRIIGACTGKDITAQAYWEGVPLAGGTLQLYRQAGGRAFDAEVTSDEGGYAVFAPRPAGRYDIVARHEGIPSGQTVFAVQDCRVSPMPAETRPEVRVPDELIANASSPSFSRLMYRTYLQDGLAATRIVITRNMSAAGEMQELVPYSLVPDAQRIGFEGAYPDRILQSPTGTLLVWDAKAPGTAQAQYTVAKALRPVDINKFSAVGSEPIAWQPGSLMDAIGFVAVAVGVLAVGAVIVAYLTVKK